MSLLENELVKKYFGDQPGDITGDYCIMAYRVLAAMQEPIKKGERYLAFLSNDLIREYTADCNVAGGVLLGHLRLPSRFQTPEKCEHKEQKCMTCGVEFPVERNPDLVEAKISKICGDDLFVDSPGMNVLSYESALLRKRCRELVALVRSTKEKQND